MEVHGDIFDKRFREPVGGSSIVCNAVVSVTGNSGGDQNRSRSIMDCLDCPNWHLVQHIVQGNDDVTLVRLTARNEYCSSKSGERSAEGREAESDRFRLFSTGGRHTLQSVGISRNRVIGAFYTKIMSGQSTAVVAYSR